MLPFYPSSMLLAGRKTYAAFQAYILSIRDTATAWNDQIPASAFVRNILTTAGSITPGVHMDGTSWQSIIEGHAYVCRVVQHGLPDETVFNDQITNGRQIFVRISAGSVSGPFSSLNRNGYTSGSDPGPAYCVTCPLILYWYEDAAWQIDPSSGSAPTPLIF